MGLLSFLSAKNVKMHVSIFDQLNPSFRKNETQIEKRGVLNVLTSVQGKAGFDSDRGGFQKVGVDILLGNLFFSRKKVLLSTTIVANNQGMDGRKPAEFSVEMWANQKHLFRTSVNGEKAEPILADIAKGMSLNEASFYVLMGDKRFSPYQNFYMDGALKSDEKDRVADFVFEGAIFGLLSSIMKNCEGKSNVRFVVLAGNRSDALKPRGNQHTKE